MAIEDFMEPEVGAAVAATAIVLSSRVRNVLHRGAVYGVAGVLAAGDAMSSLSRGVSRGWRKGETQALPDGDGRTAAEPVAERQPTAEATAQ